MTPPDRFSVDPDPLTRGDNATVTYTDDTLAKGTQVDVTVTDGTNSVSLTITIGDDGSGSTTWTVPSTWGLTAIFSSTGSADHTVPVQ